MIAFIRRGYDAGKKDNGTKPACGPSMVSAPLIVQNHVPVTQLGTASSNLSFFQQVGGTVGLAITGTIFGTSLSHEVPAAMGPRVSRRR